MIRVLIVAFLLLAPHISSAQFGFFNTEEFWGKLVLHKTGDRMALSPSDTAIVVATNRKMDTSTFRFLPELRDGKETRYFVVYTGGGKWHVQPVQSLRVAVQLLREKDMDWVVYTEGMGKFFTTDVDRAMNLSGQYAVNVILLDYPSITTQRKRLGNYFFAKKNAAVAYKDFMPVLDSLKELQQQKLMGSSGINLFFHSMGNIVMREIVKQGRLGEINDQVWVNNLILNAPCVPARGHHKWVDQIAFARRTFVNYNPEDFTLGGAYLLSKRHQLGMKIRNKVSTKPVYVNFSTLVGRGHSNFLNIRGRNEIPEAAYNHYNTLLHGNAIPVQDTTLYTPTAYKGIGYDILPAKSEKVVNHP